MARKLNRETRSHRCAVHPAAIPLPSRLIDRVNRLAMGTLAPTDMFAAAPGSVVAEHLRRAGSMPYNAQAALLRAPPGGYARRSLDGRKRLTRGSEPASLLMQLALRRAQEGDTVLFMTAVDKAQMHDSPPRLPDMGVPDESMDASAASHVLIRCATAFRPCPARAPHRRTCSQLLPDVCVGATAALLGAPARSSAGSHHCGRGGGHVRCPTNGRRVCGIFGAASQCAGAFGAVRAFCRLALFVKPAKWRWRSVRGRPCFVVASDSTGGAGVAPPSGVSQSPSPARHLTAPLNGCFPLQLAVHGAHSPSRWRQLLLTV